jgi:ribonuclease R
MTDRELIRHIERSAGQRAGYKQLVRELGLGGGRERRLLLEHLARLTARRELIKLDRDHWGLPKTVQTRDNLVAGRLDLHRDGFGFVRPSARANGEEDDIFIPPNALSGAMQGDQVLVELAPPRTDGRRLGRIARVLTRRNPRVVGLFKYAHSERATVHTVIPFDERITQPILIPLGEALPCPESAKSTSHRVLGEEAKRKSYDDLEGLVVEVEITEWPTATRTARGRIIEVLGKQDDFGVDVEIIIRKHHLPHIFPDSVLQEARETAYLDHEVIAMRRDFRDLPIVTIDGETARDFDDAVLVREHRDGGFELQVHIADVAHYVQRGTALDLEARLRGNSVYFPDRAIPMLPQELSTDICSLRPNEDRLVLSCLMRIDHQGDVLSYEITEGVIRSARRMTYTQVHAVLEGDEAVSSEFIDLIPEFERMHRLALILNKKRERRGSIDFDLPEPIIEFDEFGAMKSVTRSERNWAHRLIEEFMLAANECVASWIENLGVDSIYRIHEKPAPRRVVEFEETAATFGYSLGIGNLPVRKFEMKSDRREQRHRGGRNLRQHEVPEEIAITPRMYQRLTAKIAGKPEERILSYLMLRSLKQARYSEKNEGHFALAAPCYTHFTSPIRRYPDLIVHRIAKALLTEGVTGEGRLLPGEPHSLRSSPWDQATGRHHRATVESPIPEIELAGIAQESSENERRAAEAERELVEWKKAKFMAERVGEDFDAMILSTTKYGLFVELDELFVEGLVPIQSLGQLDGDYYTYRENTRQIIGERWGRKFTFGQRVRVVLDRVDAVERRLQFSILERESGEKPSRPLVEKKRPQKAAKPRKQKRSMQQQSRKPKRFSGRKKGRK